MNIGIFLRETGVKTPLHSAAERFAALLLQQVNAEAADFLLQVDKA